MYSIDTHSDLHTADISPALTTITVVPFKGQGSDRLGPKKMEKLGLASVNIGKVRARAWL